MILTALCGHGHFDMVAYERYLSGEMVDYDLPQERIDAALANLGRLSRKSEPGAGVSRPPFGMKDLGSPERGRALR